MVSLSALVFYGGVTLAVVFFALGALQADGGGAALSSSHEFLPATLRKIMPDFPTLEGGGRAVRAAKAFVTFYPTYDHRKKSESLDRDRTRGQSRSAANGTIRKTCPVSY